MQRPVHQINAVSPTPERVNATLADIHIRSAYAVGSRSCFKRPRLTTAEEERQRVLYDLDARRASAFFADRVIVVEGPSDLLFFDWLARQGRLTELGANVGVLDAFGKFELHRASSTLSLFGIPHVVLWDEDAAMPTGDPNLLRRRRCQDDAALATLTACARDEGSKFAGAVRLTGTIEHWLGITEEKDGPWKAANIASSLAIAYGEAGSSIPGRVSALLALLVDLFDGRDPAPHRAVPEFEGALIERRLPEPAVDLVAAVAAFPCLECACARR